MDDSMQIMCEALCKAALLVKRCRETLTHRVALRSEGSGGDYLLGPESLAGPDSLWVSLRLGGVGYCQGRGAWTALSALN